MPVEAKDGLRFIFTPNDNLDDPFDNQPEWPRLSCPQANQLALEFGELRIDESLTVNNAISTNQLIVIGSVTTPLTIDNILTVNSAIATAQLSVSDIVTGSLNIENNLTVGNAIATQQLSVTGSLTVDNDLTVGGSLSTNEVNASGTIQANKFEGDGSALTGIIRGKWSDDGSGSIYHNNGNVGIGTNNPQAQLDIIPSGSQPWLKLGPGGDGGRLWVEYGKQLAPLLVLSDFDDASRIRFQQIGTKTEADPEFQGWIGLAKGLSNDLAIMGGNVGIGTTNPSTKLDVTGGALNISNPGQGKVLAFFSTERHWQLRQFGTGAGTALELASVGGGGNKNLLINTNGRVGIGTTSPRYKLDVRGDIGNNSTRYHSDVRWKTNVETISNALDKVLQLRGVNFEWKQEEYAQMNFNSGKQLGVIAQEVEQVVPEIVNQNEEGYKTVDYSRLTALLIEAVKELKAENNLLKKQLNSHTLIPQP